MKNLWHSLLETVGLKDRVEVEPRNYVQSHVLLDRVDLFKYMDVWRQDATKSSLEARHKRVVANYMFANYDTLVVLRKAYNPDAEVDKLRECLGFVGVSDAIPHALSCPVRIRTKGLAAGVNEVILTFQCGSSDAVRDLKKDIQEDVCFDHCAVYTTAFPHIRYKGLGPGYDYPSGGLC